MDNKEISLIATLIVAFVMTPLMPNCIMSLIDHPVVRLGLLLMPFGGLLVSYRVALLGALVVGALFLERNARKLTALGGEGTWWRSADGTSIPGPLPENIPLKAKSGKKIIVEAPYMPEGIDSCENDMESPIIAGGDIDERPVFETIIGDSSSRGVIDRVLMQNTWTDKISAVFTDSDDSYASFSS